MRISRAQLKRVCVLSSPTLPTQLAVIPHWLRAVPALLLQVSLDRLTLGIWHPIVSVRRQSSSYTCNMVRQKQGLWLLSFHAGCLCLSLRSQDFVSCYGLWELSCISDNSSICRSSTFIFSPYCAVCYCLIAHSTE